MRKVVKSINPAEDSGVRPAGRVIFFNILDEKSGKERKTLFRNVGESGLNLTNGVKNVIFCSSTRYSLLEQELTVTCRIRRGFGTEVNRNNCPKRRESGRNLRIN